MNSLAEKKVRTRIKARMALESPSVCLDSYDSSSSVNGSQHRNQDGVICPGELEAKISPPVSTNWKDIAIPRFFADYVFKSHVMFQGDLSFLPDLCVRPDGYAPLGEALEAVAWLSLSNQLRIEWLKIEACRSYFYAVEQMAKLLGDPDQAREDKTLATNYLFGLFEVGCSPSADKKNLCLTLANR